MKSFVNKIVLSSILSSSLLMGNTNLNVSQKKINISIDGMKVTDFIKLVASSTNKNIFVNDDIPGAITYAGNKPISKKDLFALLQATLEARGFTLVDNGYGYLSVVKITDATQMNLPFMKSSDIPQMQTTIFNLKYSNAESISQKVRHFTSKNAKVTTSKDSNSVLITDFPENLDTIKNAINVLDIKDEISSNSTYVVPLKNADAKSLVTTLNTIIAKMSLIPGQQPPSITSDDTTNSLIIITSDSLYKNLEKTIKDLDQNRQQVYVRAKIVEISEKKAQEIGIKYGLSGMKTGQNGLFTLNTNLGDKSLSSIVADTALSQIIELPTLTSAIGLGANLSLLSTNGGANILSEPSILCIDNLESSIYVGKTESISSGSTLTGTGLTQENYIRQDIGLTLKIKPRLSNDKKVLLNVGAKLEDIEPNSVIGRPSTTKREVQTSAIVNNGQNVIIGGLIREKRDNSVSGIPFLSEIPIIGNLFKNKSNNVDRINLVIVLTPYIVEKSEDLTKLRSQLEELDKIEEKYIKTLTSDIENKD